MTLPASAQLPNYPGFLNARTYDAEFLRMMNQCQAFGEGIAPFDQTKDCTITGMGANKAGDLEVTTGGSGLNVSVAAGNAWVQGDSRSTQGLYFCYVDVAKTVTLASNSSGNPRIDAIILQIADSDASGALNQWSITVQQGTATVDATLSNLTGAPGQSGGPSLNGSALILAYVLVPNGFAGPFVNATHILDRRFFAYRPGRIIGYVDTASTNSQTWSGAGYSTSSILTLTAALNNAYKTRLGISGQWIDGNGGAGTDIAIVGRYDAGAADHVAVQATLAANNYKHGFPANLGKPRTWDGQRTYKMYSYKSAAGSASVNVGAAAEVPIQMWLQYV